MIYLIRPHLWYSRAVAASSGQRKTCCPGCVPVSPTPTAQFQNIILPIWRHKMATVVEGTIFELSVIRCFFLVVKFMKTFSNWLIDLVYSTSGFSIQKVGTHHIPTKVIIKMQTKARIYLNFLFVMHIMLFVSSYLILSWFLHCCCTQILN